MHGKLPNRKQSLFFTLFLWLCGVALMFLIKTIIEAFIGPIAETWVDLTLVLVAYVMFFLLQPLQAWTTNRLRKRARRRSIRNRSSQRTPATPRPDLSEPATKPAPHTHYRLK